MEAALLEDGCGPSAWYAEFKGVLQVITKTWTSTVVSFMAENSIDLHHNIRMDGYSQQDSFLMANFIKQRASATELTRMIQCRNLLPQGVFRGFFQECTIEKIQRMT
jgi:hypothetical protein